ncbi:hypothetical protein [Clostridium botulinum]|uniref:hypothetical protein n=1 Tax=Clostridium botulinum TaxID=1491 RepID=UPI0007741ED6|nr:hypothetical protein [Clostridium botulinum]MBY6761789.1 hypothetical protein [Clostridium botulinum]NFG27253.1 hypothetical protein [Clostridium botulinum]NFN09393.1 hypothetical protein [Clostridium botulinum]NFN32927.1 hypothetical protein [Clostridium botulinum]
MKTIIYYDTTGNVIFLQEGTFYKPIGEIKTIEIEIPNGKFAKQIDYKNEKVIFEDLPKSNIELLQEELAQNTKEIAKKDLAIEQLQKDLADLTKQIALGGNV